MLMCKGNNIDFFGNPILWYFFIVLLLSVCPAPAHAETTLPDPLLFAEVTQEDAGRHDRMLNPVLNKGVLLIAGKNLHDPNFEKTIILVTEYTDNGTAGLVLNRRSELPVAEALPKLSNYMPYLDYLYIGGPVASTTVSLLLKSEAPLQGTNQVITDIYHINTLELFNILLINKIDEQFIRIYAGFAGWAPGQLESELIRGDWYIWHADINTIFNAEPDIQWDELIRIVLPVYSPENMI
jgi:putative transcriptional regulator